MMHNQIYRGLHKMSGVQLKGIPKETVEELKDMTERLKVVKAFLLVKLSNCETFIQGITDLVNEIELTRI